ncbi:hypothetical protein HAX54_011580 [Datura stramonium]|uniref:Uncharacterized protein n=1 Tax=Datura stramonium TaxID=4076 RepID=A0ABS8TK82_DATST|nr:hypothetical protein [Datura stramonium]
MEAKVNINEIIKDVLTRARVKKGQRFGFGGLLTRFLRGHKIEKDVVDYRPRYDLKTKDLKGLHGPMIYISERHARINNMLSDLYGMQMFQLRMNKVTKEQLHQLNMEYPLSEQSKTLCRVRPIFEEPLDDDDDITDEEQA